MSVSLTPLRVFGLLVDIGLVHPLEMAKVLTVITGRSIKPGMHLEPDEITDVIQLLERCLAHPNPPAALDQALAEITAGKPE